MATSDADAYAASGQKCSAQSILFAHQNWVDEGFFDRAKLAARRNLAELTVGPVLTQTTEQMLEHAEALASLPGAYVAFGGKELEGNTAPPQYGCIEPTAVYVPLDQILASEENFALATKEVFGPFQVITSFDDASEELVLEACERMTNHLTAAVVSNDPRFQERVLGSTVNGTTYCGRKARTTGAPQNHWFGPSG